MKTPAIEDLKRAMMNLPREHRQVLLLSYADELSVEEIAAVLRIGADQAQAMLLEAVEALGIHFEPAPAA